MDASARCRRSRVRWSSWLVVGTLATSRAFAGAGDESFARVWQRLQHKPDAERADALEAFVDGWPEERDRRAALSALHDALGTGAPPLSAQEWWDLEALARGNDGCQELLTGRHVVLLATHNFAESARQLDLVRRLDLAYCGLHALFGTDPVASRRHRVYVFPDPSWSSVLQINRDALRIRLPWERRDDARLFDELCHEFSHAFVGDHPAWHLYAAGFFEGWGDFAPVYCNDWVGAIDDKLANHARELMNTVRNAGEIEYLSTRLAIEDAVGYAPAGALFAELSLATRDDRGVVDWQPWRRLFRERSFLPLTSRSSWSPRLARELEWAFGTERALPILRRWRFPPGEVAQALNEDIPTLVPSAAALGERWAARGERVLRGWRVLGPIPDRKRWLLEFDPFDGATMAGGAALAPFAAGAPSATRELDGANYSWRENVESDAYGTLKLETLPGSGQPANYYLVRDFAADEPPPAEIALASEDRALAWLDGVELTRVPDPRRVDVFDATRATGTTRAGAHRLVVLVADEGGNAWVNVRASSKSPLLAAWRAELESNEAARRAAACACLGTRGELRENAVALLASALSDSAPEVRRAAASALGGQRNDSAALEALSKRAQREKDPSVKAALEASLRELLLTPRNESLDLERGVERVASEYAARWWFVECERSVRDGREIGGFYGARDGAYGQQSLGREWGSDEKSWFAVTLQCRAAGARTLRLRYVQPDRDDARIALELRRGQRKVWTSDLHLPRTSSWSDWRWVEIAVPELESGAYQLHVLSTAESASPDLDVIGWR